MKKIYITNATIIDGTKKNRYIGQVLVHGSRIEEMTLDVNLNYLQESDIEHIDGEGLVLCPGFIDTHSHSDLRVLECKVLEPKIRQGITTEILGQDGIAMAPLPVKYISDWKKNIGGLEGKNNSVDWTYETVEGYMNAIKSAKPTSNMMYLIPHGNVRITVLGLEDKIPNQRDIEQMKAVVRNAMDLGCAGLSSGLIYTPCAYSGEEEIIELCKVVAEFEGAFVVHQRSEANTILESMDEIIRIGMASGVHIHFSHFKICGKNNWHLLGNVLNKLDEAKEKGVKVTFDLYPYTAGSTMLGIVLPPWVHDGGTNKMLERLKDQQIRDILKDELLEQGSTWDNFIEFAGTSGIYITSVDSQENQKVIGKNLDEIGVMRGQDPIEAVFDLLIEENNNVGMIDYYGSEDHINEFIKRDEMNVCTDGLLGGKPHPRTYGAFPRIIAKYVKQEEVITLEEAIHKMTYHPAQLFGMVDRGLIQEGAYADILLFDESEFKDLGTYLEPEQFPTGLKMVMVNGRLVFDGKVYYMESCGRMLKHNNRGGYYVKSFAYGKQLQYN